MCPGVGPEGRLRCFAHLLGGGACRGHAQYPAFAPVSSEVAVGFLRLCIFWVQNLSQLGRHVVVFSLIQFLWFLFLEERRVQVQALQQRVPSGLCQHQFPGCAVL